MVNLKTLLERRCEPGIGAALGLAAAGVLLSADVHLELWLQGVRLDAVFGPLFLATAAAGLVVGILCVAWPSRGAAAAAAVFGAMTFGALLMSSAVGLFGLHETLDALPQQLSLASEATAAIAGSAALMLMRRQPATTRPVLAGALR